MYGGWRDAWQNWPRSLPMRDRFSGVMTLRGLIEVMLVQALPLWLAPLFARLFGSRHPASVLNAALVCARLGVLAGTARAYERRPWTYWLSPLCDLPVVLRLWSMAWRRNHVWRGRTFVTGETH
jgi:dolichol-phosphate mannosyltransferase